MPVLIIVPALLALHKIDHDIHEFQGRLAALLKDQVAVETNIVRLTEHLAELESAGRKLQTGISGHELDITSRQEHIEKMRQSLNVTKNNKEYSAILVQISAEKAEVGKIEKIALDLMQQLESNTKAASDLKIQLEKAQSSLAETQRKNSEQVGQVRQFIRELEDRRGVALAHVPPDARRQYERILLKYPGNVMAAAEFDGDDLENVSCGGCYMSLNVEDVNLLRGRDEIRKCNSCGRILFLTEMLNANAVQPS